jgi:hypothetical protein
MSLSSAESGTVEPVTDEIERDRARAAAAEQMIAAIRSYAAQVTAEKAYFPVVPPNTLTATDAMIVATALLKAVNLQVFELGLWQAWGQ